MPQNYFCRALVCGLLCGAGLLNAGCQSLGDLSFKKLPFMGSETKKVQKSAYQQPTRMVVLWSPAMYTQAGTKASRGFGGRIYFYNAKDEAIPVEGQMVVYGYDDSRTVSGKTVPDKTFAFTPKQFTEHFSPTQLGASYSIWVPWDEMGGAQADISLLPIFTSHSGQLVVGQQSKQILPGKSTVVPTLRLETREGSPVQITDTRAGYTPIGGSNGIGDIPQTVQQVGYTQPITNVGEQPNLLQRQQPSLDSPNNSIQTLSIPLPAVTADRMMHSTLPATPTSGQFNLAPAHAAPLNEVSPNLLPAPPAAATRMLGSPLGSPPAIPREHSRASLGVGPAVPRARVIPGPLPVRSGRPTLPAPTGQPSQPVGDPLPTPLFPATQP